MVAVARRPWLWPTAARQLVRLAPNRWWRHWPPLPVPTASYLRFRLQTQYGDDVRGVPEHDVVQYLEWCRRERRGRPRELPSGAAERRR